jgi:hypothetical protein
MFIIYISRRRFSSERIDITADERHSSDNMDELSHMMRWDFRPGSFPLSQTERGLAAALW